MGETFGQLVRRARAAAGLTQEELAAAAGLGVRTISDIERGRTSRPRIATVGLLARCLELSGPPAAPSWSPQATPGSPGAPAAGGAEPNGTGGADRADRADGTDRTGGTAADAAAAGPDGTRAGHLSRAPGRTPVRCASRRRTAVRAGLAPWPWAGRIVPRQLPARPAHFIGREAELRLLDGIIGRPGAATLSVIGGIAGAGKTALALQAAHGAAARFPDGQLYLNLRGFDPAAPPVPPAEAIGQVLAALEVPASRVPAGLDARAGLYRSLLAARQMLIVLDSARDSAQVAPLLPGSSGCSVIVTSRTLLASLVAAHDARLLTLGRLTDAQALELLAARLGRDRLAAEPRAAAEVWPRYAPGCRWRSAGSPPGRSSARPARWPRWPPSCARPPAGWAR